MKKVQNKNVWSWQLLLGLLLTGSTTFVSCTVEDNAIEPQQEEVVKGFFTDEINKLIDENYQEVMQKGYAELVIPASMFDQSVFNGIPAGDKEAMDYVKKAGYKVYVNGGAVRDGILGTPVHDVDFTTDATAEELVKIVPNTQITHTANFDIAQAMHVDGQRTDMVPMQAIDARLAGKPGIPDSPYTGKGVSKNLIDDSFGRDLTINALYWDYTTGNIIDYHGGLHDLRDKIIRNPVDPDLFYPIDPSTLMRTVRFAARYNFKIEEATAEAITRHMHYCDSMRHSLAFFKVMKGFGDGCGYRTYKYYLDYGLVDYLFRMLKNYAHTTDYQAYLEPAFNYLDKATKIDNTLATNVIYLPCIADSLGDAGATLKNIEAVWDRLDVNSGQREHFDYGTWEDSRPNLFNTWLLYFLMRQDTTLSDEKLVASIKENTMYPQALLLLNAKAMSESSLSKYTDFWK